MRAPAFLGFGGSPGGGELLLVFAVFLLLFGARRLPGVARGLGRSLEELRRAAREFRDGVVHAPEGDGPGAAPAAAGKEREEAGDADGQA